MPLTGSLAPGKTSKPWRINCSVASFDCWVDEGERKGWGDGGIGGSAEMLFEDGDGDAGRTFGGGLGCGLAVAFGAAGRIGGVWSCGLAAGSVGAACMETGGVGWGCVAAGVGLRLEVLAV